MTDSSSETTDEMPENVSNQSDSDNLAIDDAPLDSNISESSGDASQPDDDLESSQIAEEYEEEVEERRVNWAARILFWLILLIAGAAGALWGGPQLAPMLPQWAAPVAKYLAPGGDAALAEAQALRNDVDTRFGEVDGKFAALPSAQDVQTAAMDGVQGSLSDLEARLNDRIAALEAADDGAAAEELSDRMGAIETRLDALASEVAGVSETLRTAALDGGNLSEESIAEIASNGALMAEIQSGLETLQTDVGALKDNVSEAQGQVTGLSERLDGMQAEAVARDEAAKAAVAEAEAAAAEQARIAAINTEIDAMRSALDNGREFTAEIAALSALGVTPIPDLLVKASEGWMPTASALRAELTPLSHQAIRESIKASAGEGAAGRIGAFLQSQVATRSLEPGEGDGTDAILSRIEAAVAVDDLATVEAEAAALPDVARDLLDPWLRKVAARKAAIAAIDDIGASGS